jgi:hypothetical protein
MSTVFSPTRVSCGWSELAATNALVANEPVEAVSRMNENPILPARIFYFFSPLLYPKISPLPPPSYLSPTCPLLPTTYLPPSNPLLPFIYQPSPLTPSPKQWSLEHGSLEARAGELGAVGARELGVAWRRTHTGTR